LKRRSEILEKNECGTEKLEGMSIVADLYTEVWDARKKLLNESKQLSKLKCETTAEMFKSKADGVTVALLILAKTYGLHICPECQKVGVFVHYIGREMPDGKSHSGYICECAENCVPFEWVD
jgi:hypothetical protein